MNSKDVSFAHDDSPATTDATEALIEALLARVEQSESATARATLLAHIARLYAHELDDADRAFTALLASELELASEENEATLESLATRAGRWAELVEHRTAQLVTLAPLDRAQAWVHLGVACLERLDDPARALAAAEAALTLEARHGRAALLRVEALRRLDRGLALGEALSLAAALELDLERRAAFFVEQAAVYQRLGEPARARQSCRRAFDADPDSKDAMILLDRLVRDSGDVDALLDLLDQRARIEDGEGRDLLRREAAGLCVSAGRPNEAIRRYEEIRAEIPADLEALRALERLYAVAHVREHLEVLSSLVGAISEVNERALLNRRLAAGWEGLGELARATQALESLLATHSDELPAYDTLARLYLSQGHWRAAVDAISRHAERAEPGRRARLYLELGMLFEEHVEDPWRAVDYYAKANELAPGIEATLVALARLYEQTAALDRAARCLEDAAKLARTPGARAGRLARAGELLLARVEGEGEDRTRWAERLLMEALLVQPGYPPAARALAQLHLCRGEQRAAADLLAGAVMHAADDDERADLLIEAGQVEEALGDEERALACYRRALEADPTRRDAQVRASEMLYALGNDHEVVPLLERLCEDEPDIEVRANRLVRLARVLDATGDRPHAFSALQRAKDVVPDHFEALRLEADLLFAEGRWGMARSALERVASDDAGRLNTRQLAQVQARLGACAMALLDSSAALRSIEQALRLDPDHLVALKRAVELYAELGRWLDALAAAERIAAIEPDHKLRARYWLIAARICADELSGAEDAINYYRRALDEDPELDSASKDLERLLLVSGDHAALATHYSRRLQQLGTVAGAGDAERVRLWSALAETCEAMDDRDAARLALEAATRLDGGQLELRARLANACVLSGGADKLDRAISEHQEIISRAKGCVASYRALAELYLRTERPARARACTEAAARLVAHGLAEGPSAGPEQSGEHHGATLARRPLVADDAGLLRHADEDPFLATLWSRIAPIVAGLEALPLRALRIDPREAVSPKDARPFMLACSEAARLLDAPIPDLHVRQEQRVAAQYLNARREDVLAPTLLVGTPLLGDRRNPGDLLFTLGLRLANLRPERLLRLALPDPASIAIVLEAVIALAAEADGLRRPIHGRVGAALRSGLSPIGFDQMVTVGRRLGERSEDSLVVARRWLRATDLTAGRTALALTGDLARATQLLAHDDPAGFASPHDRLLDLISFSVTDAMFVVRSHLVDGTEAGLSGSTNGRGMRAVA